MRKFIWIQIVLIIISAAIVFWREDMPDKEVTPIKAEEAPLQSYTIVFNAEGKYNPVYLKIKKGEKVTWLNQGSGNIWPAVGPHPTHDQYTEFDAKRKIQPGENFSFTFDRVGIWQYHNHIDGGQMVGMVEVSE